MISAMLGKFPLLFREFRVECEHKTCRLTNLVVYNLGNGRDAF